MAVGYNPLDGCERAGPFLGASFFYPEDERKEMTPKGSLASNPELSQLT